MDCFLFVESTPSTYSLSEIQAHYSMQDIIIINYQKQTNKQTKQNKNKNKQKKKKKRKKTTSDKLTKNYDEITSNSPVQLLLLLLFVNAKTYN